MLNVTQDSIGLESVSVHTHTGTIALNMLNVTQDSIGLESVSVHTHTGTNSTPKS